MYKEIIGIIGGFGAYATLDFYKRILQEFASDSERNYPHIIMDNNFTMPSRTRALLYDEAYEEVLGDIVNSVKMMMEYNASKIVLVCGTAHYFMEDTYRLLPEAKNRIVNIIDVLGEELQEKKIDHVLVVAAEGALAKGLYKKVLHKYDIVVQQPGESDYEEIRYFIECVKRNTLHKEAADRFICFLEEKKAKNVVLGCTEFPVLIDYLREKHGEVLNRYSFFDPLEMTVLRIKKILK